MGIFFVLGFLLLHRCTQSNAKYIDTLGDVVDSKYVNSGYMNMAMQCLKYKFGEIGTGPMENCLCLQRVLGVGCPVPGASVHKRRRRASPPNPLREFSCAHSQSVCSPCVLVFSSAPSTRGPGTRAPGTGHPAPRLCRSHPMRKKAGCV